MQNIELTWDYLNFIIQNLLFINFLFQKLLDKFISGKIIWYVQYHLDPMDSIFSSFTKHKKTSWIGFCQLNYH